MTLTTSPLPVSCAILCLSIQQPHTLNQVLAKSPDFKKLQPRWLHLNTNASQTYKAKGGSETDKFTILQTKTKHNRHWYRGHWMILVICPHLSWQDQLLLPEHSAAVYASPLLTSHPYSTYPQSWFSNSGVQLWQEQQWPSLLGHEYS